LALPIAEIHSRYQYGIDQLGQYVICQWGY
jgi:hypothetical protein